MNAKSLIVGLILFMSVPLNVLSIESTDNEAGWGDKEDRSISSSPSLSIDGNTLYIYSHKQLDNLRVQIKDLTGGLLYSEVITVLSGAEYPISLDAIPSGDYQVLLTQGDNSLIENFTK